MCTEKSRSSPIESIGETTANTSTARPAAEGRELGRRHRPAPARERPRAPA